MSYIQLSRTTIAVLLGVFLLHSCQQPQLSMAGDELKQQAPSTPQALSPKARQSTEATTKQEPSRVVLTSSSDSSPEAKNADQVRCSNVSAPISASQQGNVLASASADTIMPKSSDESVKKRSGQEDVVGKEQLAKRQKQEAGNSDLETLLENITTALDNLDRLESSNEESYEYDYVFNRLNEIFSKHKNDLKETGKSTTLLHQAASEGHLDIVKYLVEEQEIVPQSRGEKGAMALHCAASRGHLDIVKYLVEEQEVDPKSKDEEGAMALHYAAAGRQEVDNKKIVAYFVQQQELGLNETFNDGSSLLGLAVATANLSIVEYWIEYYADDNNKKEKWDDEVKNLTESALNVAKYRESNIKEEQALQGRIVHLLDAFLESNQ